MSLVLLVLWWSAAALVLYTYLLFPALVFLRGLLGRRPYKPGEITPRLSLIIAAHNEANTIGAKLDNILSLDYPHERLEVVVASDGSTDNTEAIVSRYARQGIKSLSLPRQGKAPALNAAVAASTGEILVFSDANSMYAPDALRALTRPFADPEVGGVAGDQRYLSGRRADLGSEGERRYWDFDRKLKQFQSRAGSAISATGAIYAIRRSLFRPVPAGVTDDFVTSTQVIAQGHRLVFAPEAVAYEPVAKSSQVEFGRKVRVITRGLRAVLVMRQLLNPFRYGFYAIQLLSHKVLRRLVVFPLLALLLVSPFLWRDGLIYQLALLAQLTFYGSALIGLGLGRARLGWSKFFTLPFFFCMVNTAAFVATWNVVRGRTIDRWEPQRADVRAGANQERPASYFTLH
ncbi:MAG TPA: glycosyltransferase family 2 protein [Anaerolineales bacterium]|nr:glycosyltransferase family 2 protein [Anaerolineales bacterium]